MFSRRVIGASVTPLASIFGSGFLIIVPILERTLGPLSILGIAGVCLFAWSIGSAVRHNVANSERLRAEGRLDPFTGRVEELADLVIVVAYVISVALYLRIMAQYVIEFVASSSATTERALATAAVSLIVAVGVVRGFDGLDVMDRVALAAVMVLTVILGAALLIHDGASLAGSGVDLPPVPGKDLSQVLLVLGGIVITVQGFETVRYLGEEYDQATRIWASRLSQVVSTLIYIGFVAVATPVMGLGSPAGADSTLLDITGRVVGLLSLPLVITATLSQFSAATADTVAAEGNLHRLTGDWLRRPRPYILTGVGAVALLWTLPTLTIVAVASRAFAAYYGLQCVIAVRTTSSGLAKLGFGALATILAAVTLLAEPAG